MTNAKIFQGFHDDKKVEEQVTQTVVGYSVLEKLKKIITKHC